MAKLVVVYHSGYGHTQRMAEAVAEGASATLVAIDAEGNLSEANWGLLQAADGIIMGSPTYMGSVSWQFKKFADASSKPWFSQQWKDKVFAGWVGTGMMPSNKKSAQRDDINYVGSFAGAMAQSPSDSSPAEMLAGDLATAKLFGQRVAEVTLRFKS